MKTDGEIITEMAKYIKLVDEMGVGKGIQKANTILSVEEYEIFCTRLLAALHIINKHKSWKLKE